MREIIQNNREAKKASLLDPRLVNYVAQCRKMRIAEEEIRKKLLKVGWSAEETDRVLGKAKAEANISFLSPSAKTVSIEKMNSREASQEAVKKEFPKKEKKTGFFSKKTILVIVTILLVLTFLVLVGYYFFSGKNNPLSKNKASVQNSNELVEADCSAKKFEKPESAGSAVLRIDSTMKLLINAISEGNYCWTMSLFSDDSKDKYAELIRIIIENEGKRNNFLTDLKGYMIPAIDESDPMAEAKATIISSGTGTKSAYNIIFIKKESGEYLISSM